MFDNTRFKQAFEYYINNQLIGVASSVKYLGMIFTRTLSWKKKYILRYREGKQNAQLC